jgi:cysteine-rich repeat protein
MKILASRPVGLVGVLLLAAGCGSSSAGGGDAPVDASVGATQDGQTPISTDDGGTSDDAATGPTSDAAAFCGDGIVNGAEQCDDGAANGTPGDGCTNSCTWVCIQGDPKLGDPACNDGNPCNGTETCLATHACAPGTPPPSGTACGTGEICDNQLCAPAVCGDGIVTAPEECDDGSANGSATDGCTKSCTFVCVATDPTRNCTPADPCQGKGTCNATTHVCAAGTPEGDGTICSGGTALDGGVSDSGAGDAGAIEVCKTGVCVAGSCGDGVLESGEQCDFGAGNGPTTGCQANCTFSCTKTPTDSCTKADICSGVSTCTTVVVTGDTGQACVTAAPPGDGTACGTGGKCLGGVCTTTTCGNGVLDPGEQCDFGAGKNIAGSGCEPDCQFSCEKTPTDTCQTNVCAANPTLCTTVAAVAGGTSGQKCQATTELAACGDCSATGVCVANACPPSRCGDGCVDPRTGETCDPPNTATCDANCHTIAAAVCGNGILETGEQCDDGNVINLDGCNSTCKFEQDQRANGVTIATTVDTFCATNALGNKALTGLAVGVLNTSLATAVKNGTTTIEFQFLGINDLTGTAQASGLQLGALSGAPVDPDAGAYDGTNDTDWWYTTSPSDIDSTRTAISLLQATFAAKVLKASGNLDLHVTIGGPPTADLHVSGATVQANIGAVSTPLTSTGAPPGHLASEHLSPTIQSFGTMTNGLLCGNISAESLSKVSVPAVLLSGGMYACSSPVYTTANSLLDVLVGGCTIIVIPAVNKTQPDQIDPSAPVVAGTTPPYTLTAGAGNIVTGCTDKNGKSQANLAACLSAAAYSSYFDFTSDRVIAK